MINRLITLCAVASIGVAIFILVDPIRLSPTVHAPVRNKEAVFSVHADRLIPLTTVESSTPLKNALYVPSAGIELSIERGSFNQSKNTWNVPGNRAYLADGSVAPNGNTGTSYIYGHNNKYAFSALNKLKSGDIAVIKNDTASYYYELIESRVSNPNDLSLLSTEGKPTLILQTCTGLRNEYRAQYIFRLARVS